jgi:hypothetical protein
MLRAVRSLALGCVVLGLSVTGLATAGAQTYSTEVNANGVGKPPPGSGLGTKAALSNPKCNADSVKGYGTFNFVTEGFGPFCVAPAPKDNGGATAPGVTATSIKVVVGIPNAAQIAVASSKPLNRATGAVGNWKDSWADTWAPYQQNYEFWGRTPEFVFVESTGDDEAAQRADAVTVKAEKPFAFIDATPNGLPMLQSLVAADKTVVYGNVGVGFEDTQDQAPYRWGATDAQAAAFVTAEWAGKQLTKGKAQWAGDAATQAKPRAFGAVYSDTIDIDQFTSTFKKYGGTLATPAFEYQASGGTLGDATTAQQQAPTIIARLKDAGITSVFLFSDAAMNKALTTTAAQQDFNPEWLDTGFQFADLGLLSRGYDQKQWGHAFGMSGLGPFVTTASVSPVFDWYWGPSAGTSSTYTSLGTAWLAEGLQYAGPKLSAKNFQLGYFATPARSGIAYGKTAGLPYDEYMSRGGSLSAMWYDPTTVGTSQVRNAVAAGVTWYLDNGKGYRAGEIPKKTFTFFDKTGAAFVLDTPRIPLGPVVPCDNCPSQGGTSSTAASS